MMKRLLLTSLTVVVVLTNTQANKLTNIPQTIIQPDGSVINCLSSGDEFYHYLHDKNGYTIVMNPDDGFFYYGEKEAFFVSMRMKGF